MKSNKILTDRIRQNVFTASTEGDMYLFTLSDMHIGLGNLEYINHILDMVKKLPNAVVCIGSDVVDNPTRNSKGSVIECYLNPQEQIEKAVELLLPIKDKVALILDAGNHENRTMNESYISITQMIATLMGITDKYRKDFAIGYLGAGENWYTSCTYHQHRRDQVLMSTMNTDLLILEHTHKLEFLEQLKVEHNKFTKEPTVRSSYIVHNGSMMSYAGYAARGGYPMQTMGTYVIQLSSKRDRQITIWRDEDFGKNVVWGKG